ncbi:MAG: CZB domain-containing protein [Nitrospirota bacterium]|nr:MAG: CZB domain-containing protein [Nitrospirota bacterium]
MNELEFKCAIDHHLVWKRKLRGFLDGVESIKEAEALSHKDCDLGKWLISEHSNEYYSLPEVGELEQIHEQLHAKVRLILQMKYSGDLAGAEKELIEMENLSDMIIRLLDRIRQRISESTK